MNTEIFNLYKIPILFGVFALFFFVLAILGSSNTSEKKSSLDEINVISAGENSDSSKRIMVDIEGEVMNPGVYELSVQARIKELIDLSGGFSSRADSDWIQKNLNQAQILKDGSKIYIPSLQEKDSVDSSTRLNKSARVNINTGSESELKSLSGIGDKRASDIIQNRPYSSAEELVEKGILSESLFEEIKDSISVF